MLWCIFHSVLISLSARQFFAERLGERYRYYRLFYVFFAAITLISILVYRYSIATISLFTWQGNLRLIQILLIIGALYLFIGGARNYDLLQFMGIRQIREGKDHKGIGDQGEFKTDGVMGMIRHPWYLGGILIVWARPLDTATLVTNVILTSYLVFGTLLEERRLIKTFGEQYNDYQHQVSMLFFPWKWLKKKASKLFKQNKF